jgi:RNA polymerase sigma-70 factor (ECF subfamily)
VEVDQHIVEQFKNGDSEASFRLLISTYQSRLYQHIRRMVGSHADADDVLQNTFVKAWKGLPKFRSESKLHTWMYRIATNESLTWIEKNKKRATVDIDSTHLYAVSDQHGPSAEEIQAKLKKAMALLPPKQLAVFSMKYFEEMKYDDIAQVTGTSAGALKASYHHAVKKIEEFLTQN